jgi:apolipoprotein N-acyltransferase
LKTGDFTNYPQVGTLLVRMRFFANNLPKRLTLTRKVVSLTIMRVLLYIAGGFVAMALAALLITRGQAPDSNPLILSAFVALFFVAPLGAFWMMYMAIRYEKHPLPMVLLAAFIPFTFLWYYAERVRPRKLRRNRDIA